MWKNFNQLGKIALTLVSFGLFLLILFTGLAQSAKGTIVIDAGHGSAVNSRGNEGSTELAIANKLKAKLESQGYNVVMTRTSNGQAIGGVSSGEEYQDLIARAKIANQAGANMVISLHSDDRSNDAFEVIYPDATGSPRHGLTQVGHIGNYYQEAKKMAQSVYSGLQSSGFSPGSRGLHGESLNRGDSPNVPFMISAQSKAPVITVEVYGHNSSNLREKYASASAQERVANALANGVNKYFSSSPSSGSSQPGSSGAPQTGAQTSNPKIKKSDCPENAPAAGPSYGDDWTEEIAQSYAQQQNELANAYAGGGYLNPASGPIQVTGNGMCALPIPGNTNVVSGLNSMRGNSQHRGYDFPAPTGTNVVSVMDGVIIKSEDYWNDQSGNNYGSKIQNGGFGNRIVIQHANGLYSEYHHFSHGSLLPVGTQVKKGQPIGRVDNTGWSSGSHLHFQMMNSPDYHDFIDPAFCLK